VSIGDHTFEPVPFAVSTYSAIAHHLQIEKLEEKSDLLSLNDSVERYDEISACEGSLGRFPGSELIGILKRFKEAVKDIHEVANLLK
jgi:2,3-bisphosphoglycerate-independent phosphoglycerate mutase